MLFLKRAPLAMCTTHRNNNRKPLLPLPLPAKVPSTYMVYSRISFIYEYHGYEHGKDLLRKSGEISHQNAALNGHCDDSKDAYPETYPGAERHEFYMVIIAELK